MKTMKMAAVSGITLLLLLCCSFISSKESDCNSFAARGEAFTVPLGHKLEDTNILKWKHGSVTIVERKPQDNGKGYKFVKGSKDDIFLNGSLNLRNVTKANEGEYIPSVYSADGVSVQNIKSVHLCVLDRAPQPTLKSKCFPDYVQLTCDVGKVKDLKFFWLQNNKVLNNLKSQVWNPKLKDVGQDSVHCRVSNSLGSNTSEPVTGLCNPSIFPIDLWGLIWICVGGGGGLVLLLTIIVIVCCVRAKRKKRIQKKDEEELRLRWADPEQQQQHQCPQHGHPASRRHQDQHQHQHQHQHQDQHQHQHQHQHQDQHQHQRQHQQLQQQPAGHTGPRQHRSKQHRPRAPEPPPGHPQASPRRPAQTSRADVNGDGEQPPPLPQPRSKTPRARV